MSEYTAVRAVSQTLKELVEAHVTDPTVQVFLTSPKEMQQNKQTGISIWLYRLTRNEFLLNQPRRRPRRVLTMDLDPQCAHVDA